MMSLEIQPQYLAEDDDASEGMDGNESLGLEEGDVVGDEYGDEVMGEPEFTKIKKDKIFMPIDYTKRKTKIVCTLGPSSSEVDQIVKLFDAGMSMARINLSHGTIKSNLKIINKFKLAKRLRPHKTCALMIETRGREVRMSHISAKTPTMRIRSGSSVNMFGGEYHVASDAQNLRIDNDQIQRYFKPNDVVYFDDGKVVGIVTEINASGCKMEIKIGGQLKGNCAVRFTGGKHNNLQLVQKKDIDDIAAISQVTIIDYLAIPFCASGADPLTVRELLGPNGKDIKIVSKIDTLEGVQQYENILKHSDSCIFVRNELQWELAAEKLMLAQKWVIESANAAAKPIMLQSQMIESMIAADKKPERTELSEISTVTLDGADCFILSHETSVGDQCVEATICLAKAIAEAENIYDYDQASTNVRAEIKKEGHKANNIDILAATGCSIAFDPRENVDMFVCLTDDGMIARHLAKQRPKQPILACSISGQTVRQMNMVRGIVGYKIPQYMKSKTDDLINLILQVAQEQLICNLPSSKVMIFIGQNEGDEKKELYTFKLIGGDKNLDEEDEDGEVDEGEEQDS